MDLKLNEKDNITCKFSKTDCIDDNNEYSIVNGEIFLNNDCVGYIDGYLIYNDENFYDICDDISGDCEIIANTICNEDGTIKDIYINNESAWEEIFILDRIEITKEYRKKGLGSIIVKNLSNLLKYEYNCGTNIFLCASSFHDGNTLGFQSKEYIENSNKLIKFYEKFGYSLIKNNIMYKND